MSKTPNYYKVHTDGHEVALEPIYEELVPVVHGRWISVEDRLPEVGQCVLVWCESRMFKKHITISTYMRTYSAERETYFSRRVRNVTHWMPLPQPPKGELG